MRRIWVSGSLALSLILTGCGEADAPRGEPYFEKPASQEAREVLGEVAAVGDSGESVDEDDDDDEEQADV